MSFDIAAPIPVAASTGIEVQESGQPALTGGGKHYKTPKPRPAPTEMAAKRTIYSTTYDNHDGTFTARISTGPVNYKPAGSSVLQTIDTTLAAMGGTGGRVRASHMATPVEVGGAADAGGFVSMDTGKGIIRMFLAPGDAPGKSGEKPVANGSKASVAGLIGDIDLEANVDATGVRTFFVLHSQPSSPSFSLALDTGGLTPSLQADGSIKFFDSKGNLAASMPRPFAEDSDVDPGVGAGNVTTAVSYSLQASGKRWILKVAVDAAWLADATYPVYVDPSVVGTSYVWNNTVNNQSAYINTVLKDMYSHTGYHEFLVGYDGASQWAAYLRFNLEGAGISGDIASVTLNMYPWHQWYTSGERTWVKKVATSWDTNTITWNNAPFHSAPYPTSDANFVGNEGQWTQNASWTGLANLTTWARDWVSSPSTNYGIYLYGNQGATTYWKRFTSSQNGTTNRPYLDVTYSLPSVTVDSPAGNDWTNSRTLSWTYSDPSSFAQAKSAVQVATDSGFANKIYDSGQATNTVSSWDIPAGTSLTNGSTYYWRVQAYDGYGWSPWSNTAQFRWDAGVPASPSFTAPASGGDFAAGTSYDFSWGAVTDTSGVQYDVTPQSAPATGTPGECSTAWTDMEEGGLQEVTSYTLDNLASSTCYRLRAHTVDGAGNPSDEAYSPAVFADLSTPDAPVITDNCAVIGSCYRFNNIVYFDPAAAKTVTLTSTGTDTPSGIGSSGFGPLSDSQGWTYEAGSVTGNPAQKTLTWSADSLQTSLEITAVNRAGTSSGATVITFVPNPGLLTDPGAMADFSSPVSGTETTTIQPDEEFTVSWTETPGLSLIIGRSLQRWSVAANGNGTCPTEGWAADGDPSTAESPVVEPSTTFSTGTCYRWVQILTDSIGTHDFTSASLTIDATAPTAEIATPLANQPLAGNVAVKGTAIDTYFNEYTLEYGSGASPTEWTTIATSSAPVAAGGTLGTWVPGNMSGIYTLRLRVSDLAGNVTTVTRTIYLENSNRGVEGYNTSEDFDLGGGWALGVNVGTGEATLSRGLFAIPSYGPQQSLSLAYNSADSSSSGFGPGWSSNLTQRLDVSAVTSNFLVWHRADGAVVPFGKIAGVWTVLPGHFETLAEVTGGYQITEPDHSSLAFDATGRLTAMTDRFGTALTIDWNSSAVTVTDASGHQTLITIEGGLITQVADSANRAWHFAYTAGSLTTITDPEGKGTLLDYASGRLTTITRSRTPVGGSSVSVVWSLEYDGTTGRTSAVVDPIGGQDHKATFTYGESYATGTTTVVRPRDSAGAVPDATTIYTLDDSGRGWVSSMERYATAVNDPEPVSWASSFERDANGNLLTESHQIDATHYATTTRTYGTVGNVLTEEDPIGIATTLTYDSWNDLVHKVISAGTLSQDTAYVYDATHHLCREVANPTVTWGEITCTSDLPSSSTDRNVDTRYTHNSRNQMASKTDPRGVVTRYQYDYETDPSDDWGNQTSVTRNYIYGATPDNATNVTTTYEYDAAGNVISETSPVDVVASISATKLYTYDLLGRGLTERDPGDMTTPAIRSVNVYDEFGAKVSVTQQACVMAEGACSWANLSTTTTTYNKLGFATATTQTTPASGSIPEISSTTTYSPDLAGDVLSSTDANAVITTATFDALGQTLTATATGGTTEHSYDGLGREVQTVAPGSAVATLTTDRSFDASGHQLSEVKTDSSDNSTSTTTYTLDALGRRSITSSPDTTTTQTYDKLGRVTTSVSGTSATDTEYDRADNVTAIKGPYDSEEQNPDKPETSQTYDAMGRMTATTLEGVTEHSYYDAAGNVVASTDGNAHVARNFFNVAGQVTKTINNCTNTGTTPPGDPVACAGTGTADSATNVVTTNEYSPTGNLYVSHRFVAGVQTDTRYDGAGRVTSKTADVGGLALTTSYTYDSAGRQTRETDPRGVVTATVYDASGHACRSIANLTADLGSLSDPCTDSLPGASGTANLDTRYSYDQAGNKTIEVAWNGTATRYEYDGDGNLTAQIGNWIPNYQGSDPTVNSTTSYLPDDAGRQSLITDPAGSVIATVYDEDGRVCREIRSSSFANAIDPTKLTHPCTDALPDQTVLDNIDTQYTYDAAGSKIKVIAPSPADDATPSLTVITLYAYDLNQRLCRVVEHADGALDLQALADPCHGAISSSKSANIDTQYGYDDNGNMTSQFTAGDPDDGDPSGTIQWSYDALNRMIGRTDPLNQVMTWAYDSRGNKAGQFESDGHKIYWFYDSVGRLCRRIAFFQITDFTPPSQPCEATAPYPNANVDIVYGYDEAGNQTSAKELSNGHEMQATYDALNRVLTTNYIGGALSDPGTTYTYDSTNQVTRIDPSGSYTFTLNGAGSQSALSVRPAGSATDLPFGWTYGATGAQAAQTDPTGNTTGFARDALGRLISQATDASGSNRASYTYGYNQAGNRISSTATIPTNVHLTSGYSDSFAYTYDPLGRLLTYSPTAPAAHQSYAWDATPDRTSITIGSDPPVATSYNAAGRPVTDASHLSDAEGRVVHTPGPGGSVLDVTWDPLGRLGSVTNLSTGGTSFYSYDPLDRLSTIQYVLGSATTTTMFLYVGLTDAVAFVDVHTGSGDTYTCHLSDVSGASLGDYDPASGLVTYTTLDAHGDTVWTSGSDGIPSAYAVYDPFGNMASGSVTTPIRWQGSWQDTSSGLYYVVARWYDALSGRFLSEDPVEQNPTTPQARNLYSYGSGDAIGQIDPDGRTGVLHDGGSTRIMLDTSLVGLFHEPFFSDAVGNWGLCQTGALRVVLAFAGWAPQWKLGQASGGPLWLLWPTTSYTDQGTGKISKVDSAYGEWRYGQSYMLYLGYQVKAPYMTTNGMRWASDIPRHTADLANWENQSEPRNSRGQPVFRGPKPFHYVRYSISSVTFKNNVIASIDNGVPVWWSGRTASFYENVGLPSWRVWHNPNPRNDWTTKRNLKLPGGRWSDYHSLGAGFGHAVAIVGYDSANFYYVDTCARGQFDRGWLACRTGPADGDRGTQEARAQSGVPHVWRISQLDLWKLMHEWTLAGYVWYDGSGRYHIPW